MEQRRHKGRIAVGPLSELLPSLSGRRERNGRSEMGMRNGKRVTCFVQVRFTQGTPSPLCQNTVSAPLHSRQEMLRAILLM